MVAVISTKIAHDRIIKQTKKIDEHANESRNPFKSL